MRDFPLPLPKRMYGLPVDKRGYPVPRFVEASIDPPDFRVMSPSHMARCVRSKLCWICGEPLGANKVFVIGPMCTCNRLSSEPPSHYECALFAATACPFLSKPQAKRREARLPDEIKPPAGIMLPHNPGVTALWVTKSFRLEMTGRGPLFRLEADPERIEFFAYGRLASRAEVEIGIGKGLPKLRALAKADGPKAEAELVRQIDRMNRLLDRQSYRPEAA